MLQRRILFICILVFLEAHFQGKFPEVEPLGQKANAYVVLLDTAKVPSKRVVPNLHSY